VTAPPAIPAATLIVLRESSRLRAAPELLLVERSQGMAFAAGAMVFPGGRVDPDDQQLAAALGRPDDGAKVTAIRETLEETGVAVALGPVAPARGTALQSALLDGQPFADLLAEQCLALDLAALTPFARWMPAFAQPRRFDTLFYLAAAPPGDWRPSPQPGECAAAEWASAEALLERIAAGSARAIFPTKRNLERLARFQTHAEAVADAAAFGHDTIVPWVETRDGAELVCIPADRGYPVTSEPLATAFRA
jgi:8-oxo-dGTP pyrophosphatase MutT (NUDIX family)